MSAGHPGRQWGLPTMEPPRGGASGRWTLTCAEGQALLSAGRMALVAFL